jgi:hypothetical protein
MIVSSARWFPVMVACLLLAGCKGNERPGESGPAPDPDADIKANLARLTPEERRLAEAQKYCPVMPEVRLGEMGPPIKLVVKGETMFVCCKNCLEEAPREADKTLAQFKEIREARAKELKARVPAK